MPSWAHVMTSNNSSKVPYPPSLINKISKITIRQYIIWEREEEEEEEERRRRGQYLVKQ